MPRIVLIFGRDDGGLAEVAGRLGVLDALEARFGSLAAFAAAVGSVRDGGRMPDEGAAGRPGHADRAAHTDAAASAGPARTKFWWFGALLCLGLGLIAVAFFVVYPRPETQISIPASPSLVVYTSGHVSQVTYVAATDAGRPEMRITVSLGQTTIIRSSLTPLPVTPPPPGSSSLEVTLPQGLTFQGCGGACRRYAGEAAWVQPLDFYHGKATDVFPIKTTNFATDVSGVYAYAAIPQVSFMNPGSQQSPASGSKSLFPVLRAEYRIPAAGSYDWSSGSVPVVTGSTAMWQEIMPTSDLAGQTAAGVDHPRQVHDADFTFLAGFLLGLAGSVVLTGVQLLLPSPAGSGANSGHRTAGG